MFIQPSSSFQLSEGRSRGRSIEQQDISTLPCLLKTLIIGFCGMSKKYPHPTPPSIFLPLSVPNHMNMRQFEGKFHFTDKFGAEWFTSPVNKFAEPVSVKALKHLMQQ